MFGHSSAAAAVGDSLALVGYQGLFGGDVHVRGLAAAATVAGVLP